MEAQMDVTRIELSDKVIARYSSSLWLTLVYKFANVAHDNYRNTS